jgi:phosphonoacetate hydrolase
MTGERKRIVVVMMDGFGPEYLQASEMPNLKAMISRGFYKTVQACVPTVTNVNNASICTGTWPAVHGITANSYFNLATRQEHYMDRAEMLLAPTLFERGAKAGRRSALLTAKVKTIRLLNAGADIAVAAEAPEPEWVERLGTAPDIYSPEINYWVFAAALHLLTTDPDVAILYCHTTDYPMHMSDHMGGLSQRHLAEIDRWLGRLVDACPDLELYLTADHGMNFKRRCYDLTRLLPEKGCPIYFAMSAERDPYVKHHRTFGGCAYVWLNEWHDVLRVVEALQRLDGIEDVYSRYEAAARFRLHPDRIGDLLVLGDRDTVFGPLDRPIEDPPATFRTHGSRHEADVPLVVYGAPVDHTRWHDYTHNVHLTASLRLAADQAVGS